MTSARRVRNPPEKWSAGTIWLHWITAAFVVLALAVGWFAEHWAHETAQPPLYEIHFSLGLMAVLASVVRLGWRASNAAPNRKDRPRLQLWASRSVHALLHLTVLAALVSGTINFLFLGPIRVFGLVQVPGLFDPEADEWLRALAWYVHHYSARLLIVLLALHAGAALYHHFVRQDRVLRDFLPRRSRSRRSIRDVAPE